MTVFDEWYTVPIVKNTQNHWCTNRHRSTKTLPTVYQRCTNRQKQSKDSQNSKNDHWCSNRSRSTKTVPTVYQSSKTVKNYSYYSYLIEFTVKTQSKQQKNDHWCTNRHRSTKQKQQCNNSLPIVNKNLAIANRSRVSCAHNTSIAFIGLNITPWP